jgi:hypothetical protein
MIQKCRKLLYEVLPLPTSVSNSKLDSTATTASISNAETASSQHPADRKTFVRFNFVEIREHGRILTDHPKCKDGIALGLDWKYTTKITRVSLDLFEKLRDSQGRKTIKSMHRLSIREKQNRLVKVGGYHRDMVFNGYFNYCLSLDGASKNLKPPA